MARLELDRLLFRYDHGDLGFGPTEPQDLLTDIRQRLAALPAQQPEPEPDEPKDPNAWREARGVLKRGEPREPTESDLIDDWDLPMKPEVCGAPMRIVTGGTCANTKPCPTHDAEPVQWMAAGPKPDAATRDGDEVLRELAQWAGGEGTNELWRAVAELCRRELARGK